MKNKYEIYKIEFKEYVLLFKQGNFFICINNDAIVMNKIFNYKIVDTHNFIKTGFPISTLGKVESELTKQCVNYVIIHDKINSKIKFKNNTYLSFLDSNIMMNSYLDRINTITKILKDNVNKEEFEEILNKIEKIICKISY